MNKDYPRSARIGVQIQEVISEILVKKTKDPRLSGVSITDVKMSGDLTCAYIYFTVSRVEKKSAKDAEKGFQSAKGFFKKMIGSQLKIKYTPELRFYYDTVLDYGEKIDNLVESLNTDENSSEDGEKNS
ncbi:MAG: 30S ribosome-binding factor RbfA [Thermodesulfobacteriota bacterium]